ncbi:hypothetical protein KEM48_011705 [Puccinia striiformis f. sp. tritici PST-130]|nr:hypothetical protein KEM48_011705 [Puccinia striiformis f. sp. tritici PST-130]
MAHQRPRHSNNAMLGTFCTLLGHLHGAPSRLELLPSSRQLMYGWYRSALLGLRTLVREQALRRIYEIGGGTIDVSLRDSLSLLANESRLHQVGRWSSPSTEISKKPPLCAYKEQADRVGFCSHLITQHTYQFAIDIHT